MERKPNAASDQTKHALAEALKTLMAQKPFDKITIRDISELAGIRRQNFYYHFDDVYDLFKADIYAIIHRTVEQLGEDIGVLDAPGGNAEVEMMTHFYIIAAAGVVESWLTGEIDKTPQELIAFMDQAICDHMRGTQLRIQEMNNG